MSKRKTRRATISKPMPRPDDRSAAVREHDALIGASQLRTVALLADPSARAVGQLHANYVIADVTRRTGWDRPRLETGESAWLAMRELEVALENFAFSVAQEASSAEWLFFIRQAPYLFVDHDPIPEGYLTCHAETISALSAKQSGRSIAGPGTYRGFQIDQGSMHRLAAVALLLAQAQNLLRCAGKGCIIASRPKMLPGLLSKPEIDDMTTLWDQRMAEPSYSFLSEAGLYSHKLHTPLSLDDDSFPIVEHRNRKYILSNLPLAAIPTLSDERLPVELRFPRSVLDLIVLLISGNLFRISDKDKTSAADFERTGVNLRPRAPLLHGIEIAIELIRNKTVARSIPDTIVFDSPAAILGRLVGQEVELWPPSFGPAIRKIGEDIFLIDMYGASRRLEKAMGRPPEAVGTAMANIWSRHFEDMVQAAINSTVWRPSPKLADLRGPTLQAEGKDITDLDAVGENAGRALLVDCKSFPFSQDWDRGKYEAVRNMASNVDLAVRNWDKKMALFRANPVTRNYDFSAYSELIGVVVLPQVPWTADKNSTREIAPGLRMAVSANELDRWMHGE
jgi:hypothetical protein